MNDRYLFRGKRVDNGEWVEGYYVEAEKLDKSGIEYFIIEKSADGKSHLVIPETVGQCTGLKDKNGKLIFEWDILSFDKIRGVVGYVSGCYVFRWRYFRGYRLDLLKECILTDYTDFDNFEIIGNIHDNPELLEVKE